jgi:glucose-6-phosphate isomerase
MPLTLDYTHCLAGTIGATHGLIDSEIDTLVAKFPKHHENIEELRSSGESAFFESPYQDPKPLKELAKGYKGMEAVVVIGTSGAVFTPACVHRAIGGEQWNQLPPKLRKNGPRAFFVDNPDPRALNDLTECIDPKKTLWLLVSKTGNTAETNALYLWLQGWLRKKVGKTACATHLVIATEKARSPLAEASAADKTPIIDLPANFQDRFGFLGAHVLFLGALCNFDVDAMLAGGKQMDTATRHDKALNNPAYMHSLIHYLLTRKRRKTIHAMMAFSNRAYAIVDWYSHLLSVSLGKMLNRKGKAVHVGPGPAQCAGPSGCYGQMQLYQEGPFDKVTTFIRVKDHGAALEVPKAYPKIEGMAYIGGRDISELIDGGYHAAAHVTTASGRPNMTATLDTASEADIIGLCYMLSLSAIMSAELYGIDPFNQPGVELNKQSLFAQLGRAGFEDKSAVLTAFRDQPRKTC